MPRTAVLALLLTSVPALADEPCAPGFDEHTLADGATLCLRTEDETPQCWREPDPPGLGILPPAATWTRVDVHHHQATSIPYGHTVDGFLALAPGVDRTGRMDGQSFTVLLNGMAVMTPTTPSVPLPALHRLP